ncbi:MAG: hypothetical protein H7Y42_03720 [Chitinophagaceae bacterium]|nr:hypothetical protein [Chitinophagaceae bacterium]
MASNNNTYGELINNKFSELVSTDRNSTWKEMKVILDRKMPEKKKRKWWLWFLSRAGMFTLMLFCLGAAATGYFMHQQQSPIPTTENSSTINVESHSAVVATTTPDLPTVTPEAQITNAPTPTTINGSLGKESTHKAKTKRAKISDKTNGNASILVTRATAKDTSSQVMTMMIIVPAVKDSVIAVPEVVETTPRRRAF